MSVYIVYCGIGYGDFNIHEVFDSLDKAKTCYRDNYKLKKSKWIFSEETGTYFYDGDIPPNDNWYDMFYIVHRIIK